MLMAMQLSRLVGSLPHSELTGSPEIEITGIAYDSRKAFPGCLFCCIRGLKFDGHDFAAQALEHGARALCVERDVETPAGIAKVKVPDARRALSLMSAEYFDHPSKKLTMIGVTGTNGKTTTTTLIEEMLTKLGKKAGLIGTLHVKMGGQVMDTSRFTTPESLELQERLAEMVSAGMEYLVMEVSSHSLSMKRVDSCLFDRAVFTNLTQDHLDFHGDLESYFQAKIMLFSSLAREEKRKDAMAVLNADIPWSSRIIESLEVPHVLYGRKNAGADYRALDIEVTPSGAKYTLQTPKKRIPVSLSITGIFNVYNSLAAIATACSLGIEPEAAVKAIADFRGVKGRFQMVRAGQSFSVIVDYAHTPDGLENVLMTAREITPHSLITVFGCGGDRDRTKRPIMGKIATGLSDLVIITSDNPRTEDPEAIIRDIEQGARGCERVYEKVVDRKEAIERALLLAKKGDTVVVAGKGHENYQIFKDRTIHFDDVEVVEEFFSLMKKKGFLH
jgi:UDP-N-acetylmuramoyl-L-alanyl-D-glutamate--2,6-diaminopimelate ligase